MFVGPWAWIGVNLAAPIRYSAYGRCYGPVYPYIPHVVYPYIPRCCIPLYTPCCIPHIYPMLYTPIYPMLYTPYIPPYTPCWPVQTPTFDPEPCSVPAASAFRDLTSHSGRARSDVTDTPRKLKCLQNRTDFRTECASKIKWWFYFAH